MRDEETATTALTAATTGHLVLSTLHSNTAIGSVPRLQGLGMDTQMLSESLIGVVSQRLVRIICPHCKKAYTPSSEELDYLGVQLDTVYKGEGCEACGHKGYIGRTLVYEILVVDRDVRQAMEKDIELTQLEDMVKRKGFRSMFDVGVIKVQKGMTTVEELKRVLGKTRY